MRLLTERLSYKTKLLMKEYLMLFIIIITISCNNTDKIEEGISKIEVEVVVDRFDKKFADAHVSDLPALKAEYPYFFPEQFHDSIWIAKINDTIQQELSAEVLKVFPDFKAEEDELYSLFQHMKYYFPDFKEPKIITVTTEVDYKNRIIYADSLLLVGLDNYLGEGHHFYESIYKYIRKNFEREQIVVDAATELSRRRITRTKERTFLSHLILYGKELYLKDLLVPLKTDAQKIGFTEEELAWAEENESQIWRYFVEKDLLYSTDLELLERFVMPAPYSKFYLELDNESPGRLGQYIGWQIVRAYMENNDVPLQQMLEMPAEEIFNKSKFKPKK